jgi:hypothetical protein
VSAPAPVDFGQRLRDARAAREAAAAAKVAERDAGRLRRWEEAQAGLAAGVLCRCWFHVGHAPAVLYDEMHAPMCRVCHMGGCGSA